MESKFLGCILGVAIGDALGRPFEGFHHIDPEKVERTAEFKSLTYTDDTHMTIGVAESLIRSRGFNGEHMAETFIRNYEDEPHRGYGPGPPAVFKMIKRGMAWKDSDKKLYPGGSFGNGSAMRVAPVGLFYYDDSEKLRRIAYESSRITHSHELGMEAAALQAYTVALAVSRDPAEPVRPGLYLRKLKAFTGNSVYRGKLELAENLLSEKLERSKIASKLGNSIEAFNSVPAAIFSFLAKLGSFKESVIYAVSLGGDADTIGSMTGAIAGAYYGYEAIPGKWLEKLENREHLEKLALKLLAIRESHRI